MVVEGAENERCFFAGLAGQGGGACKDEVISAAHAPSGAWGRAGRPWPFCPRARGLVPFSDRDSRPRVLKNPALEGHFFKNPPQ